MGIENLRGLSRTNTANHFPDLGSECILGVPACECEIDDFAVVARTVGGRGIPPYRPSRRTQTAGLPFRDGSRTHVRTVGPAAVWFQKSPGPWGPESRSQIGCASIRPNCSFRGRPVVETVLGMPNSRRIKWASWTCKSNIGPPTYFQPAKNYSTRWDRR